MKPGDRLIAALAGEHRAGETFAEWLLHVTIVPWFESELTSPELARILDESMQGIAPFEAVVGSEEQSRHRNKNLIRTPTPFTEINRRVEHMFHELHTKHVASGENRPYAPHVTAQRSARVHEGETFWVDRLYIISQQGGYKKIDAEVSLS